MKNKRSVRLGFVAAIWLVLSVAVFGTLIGVAWMSMNATADVSADAFVVDSVDKSTLARSRIILDSVDRARALDSVDRAHVVVDCIDRAHVVVDCIDRAHVVVDCIDGEFEEVIMAYRSKAVERPVRPSENPFPPGYMLERWVGYSSENPIPPGYLLDS